MYRIVTMEPEMTQILADRYVLVICDIRVTSCLGFTNDKGRCLVNLTRATDLSIVIGQPTTPKQGNNDHDSVMAKCFAKSWEY